MSNIDQSYRGCPATLKDFLKSVDNHEPSLRIGIPGLAANNLVENLGPLYCRRNPGLHDRSCRSAGGGAQSNGGASHPAAGRKHSVGGLPTDRVGNSPPLFVHRPWRPPAPDVRINLRPPLVLDGHALRLRLSGNGRGDRAALRLLCRLYPAARRWMVAPDLAE